MLFNSLSFAVFLSIVLSGYYLLTRKAQNLWLLAASCVFYGWWDSRFLLLLATSTLIDFLCARRMALLDHARLRKRYLLISVISNLGILGFFKYYGFFISSTKAALETIGWRLPLPILRIVLPVGISFYTFQAISYTVDVYRRVIPACRDFVAFALSVCYFPHLVAGPIQRTSYLLPQLEADRSVRWLQLREGGCLILYGLFKKVGVADAVAPQVGLRFTNPQMYGWADLLFALYLFAVQIYCDFSGYSDIARGTSKLFGIELMLNFDHPYFSRSITEFWRRWHISLSTWLREYLYIPLGGNRNGVRKTYRNLMITMLLGGLWHGASWSFVVWGALHGAYLAAHKKLLESRMPVHHPESTATGTALVLPPALAGATASFTLPDDTGTQAPPGPIMPATSVASVAVENSGGESAEGGTASPVGQGFVSLVLTALKILATFHLVCLGWIFFRAETFSAAWQYLSGIVTFRAAQGLESLNWLDFRTTILLASLMGLDIAQYRAGTQTMFLDWPWAIRGAVYAALIIVMLVFGGVNADVPFIYFQF
jgi:D-alanyl-lipoteichoic acid acyltransferase DltB (MBOAT superfamily)